MNIPDKKKKKSLLTRILTRGLLLLFLLITASFCSFYLFCVYQPDIVASRLQKELSAATGLPWRIKGSVLPVFFPGPGIAASNVSILAASAEQEYYADPARPLVQTQTLRLSLEFSSLLSLRPRLRLIELVEPVINLSYDRKGRPLWLPLEALPENEEPLAAAPAADGGPNDPGTGLQSAADTVCLLPQEVFQAVSIRQGRLMSYTSEGTLLLSFTDVEASFDPGRENNLHASAAFSLPGADLGVRFSLAARVGFDGIPATGAIEGQVDMTPPGSRTILAAFHSSLTWRQNGKDIVLPDFTFRSEGDSLTASLDVDLAKAVCTGKVRIARLSLPRWFEFGRVLPPGLQQSLHVLTGEFDLLLDATRAEAHNLVCTADNLSVTGYVGTPDFSKPAVVVRVSLDEPDLDPVFPFLAVVGTSLPEPEPLVFDHPTLAPYPEHPDAPGPPTAPGEGIGYDITIDVAEPTIHGVTGGPMQVRVFPVLIGEVEKTRVTIAAESLLQGKAEGRLDIDSTSILMHYKAQAMELALLPENEGSPVRIAGKVTGSCDIDVPLLQDGSLADDWKLTVNASIAQCDISGSYNKEPWQLRAGKASADGTGSIHAVLKNGVHIEGDWKVGAQEVRTSWNPKGNDAFSGAFSGGLFWPPIMGRPLPPGEHTRLMERKSVERVTGALVANGSLITPLGSLRVPFTGKLTTDIDWQVHGDVITLNDAHFSGFGSHFETDAVFDFSGQEPVFNAESTFKLNPQELLKGWKATPASWVRPPGLLTGKTTIRSTSTSLRFENIKVEADGAPVSGAISWQAAAPETSGTAAGNAPGAWTFRLTADHMDLDNIFPPAPPAEPPKAPSTTPWDLRSLQGLSIDAQIVLNNAKKDKLNFSKTTITGTLQRDRFSLHSETGNFYGGKCTILLQGAVVPGKSQIVLRKGLVQAQKFALGSLFLDYSGERSYGGVGEVVVDAEGVFSSNADIPAKLNGVWSLSIKDGLYPAFLSGEGSTLRNTFSSASANGPLENGVMRSNNFKLTGSMVDMSGGGWMNLTNKTYDIEVSVTFAKVPTVPVRFYGSTANPRMSVRGVEMVVETVQAAGSTVFGLIKGVLSLPGHAVQGIGGLFEKDSKNKRPATTMPLPPVKQQTGRPGQQKR